MKFIRRARLNLNSYTIWNNETEEKKCVIKVNINKCRSAITKLIVFFFFCTERKTCVCGISYDVHILALLSFDSSYCCSTRVLYLFNDESDGSDDDDTVVKSFIINSNINVIKCRECDIHNTMFVLYVNKLDQSVFA